jgi:hypothetical protein
MLRAPLARSRDIFDLIMAFERKDETETRIPRRSAVQFVGLAALLISAGRERINKITRFELRGIENNLCSRLIELG